MRRIAIALAALAALLTVAAPIHAAPDKDPYDADPLQLLPGRHACKGGASVKASHRAQRLAMHCLVNRIRRKAGLKRLRESAALRHSAIYKARRIAACKRFTHAPCGDRLAAPFHEAHLTKGGAWFIGENLGWRPFRQATAREIVRGWLISDEHRHVLLDRRFRYLGVRRRRLRLKGAPRGAVLWVAHLGVPKKRRKG